MLRKLNRHAGISGRCILNCPEAVRSTQGCLRARRHLIWCDTDAPFAAEPPFKPNTFSAHPLGEERIDSASVAAAREFLFCPNTKQGDMHAASSRLRLTFAGRFAPGDRAGTTFAT